MADPFSGTGCGTSSSKNIDATCVIDTTTTFGQFNLNQGQINDAIELRLDTLEASTGVGDAFTDLQNDIIGFQTQLTQFENDQNAQDTAITALQNGTVSTTDFATLEAKVNQNCQDIVDLQTEQVTQNATLTSIQGEVDTLENQMDQLIAGTLVIQTPFFSGQDTNNDGVVNSLDEDGSTPLQDALGEIFELAQGAADAASNSLTTIPLGPTF